MFYCNVLPSWTEIGNLHHEDPDSSQKKRLGLHFKPPCLMYPANNPEYLVDHLHQVSLLPYHKHYAQRGTGDRTQNLQLHTYLLLLSSSNPFIKAKGTYPIRLGVGPCDSQSSIPCENAIAWLLRAQHCHLGAVEMFVTQCKLQIATYTRFFLYAHWVKRSKMKISMI